MQRSPLERGLGDSSFILSKRVLGYPRSKLTPACNEGFFNQMIE